MAELAEGTPGATVLHGIPGHGRSRLLRRGVAFARTAGVQVLTAQGSAEYAHAPYAFVRQLRLPRIPAEGTPTATRSVHGWCRDLLNAARRPTLLALDDVQWADPESLQVIGTLLRRLGTAPLGLLLTVPGTRGEFPDPCVELIDQAAMLQGGRGLLLELGPLSAPDVRALCSSADVPVAESADDVWWDEAPALSGGNPWLLTRALEEVRREPGELRASELRTAFSHGIATAYRERVTESTRSLAPGALALLRGLTVCRGLLAVDRVAALVGLDEAELPGALRELRVRGLIDFGDPPRPRPTNCTVEALSGMDAEDRRQLHASAARWAHRHGADDEGLSALLLATAMPLGDPWVPWVLRRAARALRSQGRYDEAAALLERALAEPLDDAERPEVLLEAAQAYAMTAPEAAGRRIAELLKCPGARPEVRVAAVDLLYVRNEWTPEVRAKAEADADEIVESSRFSQVTAEPGPWRLDLGPAGAAGRDGRDPREAPSPQDSAAMLAAAIWGRSKQGEDATVVLDLARRLLAVEQDGALYPRLVASWALSLADAHDEARDALDRALATAGRRSGTALVGLGLMLRAELSLRAGDPDSGARDLAACCSLVPPALWHPTRLTSLRATRIQLLVAQERYAEADRLAREELPRGVELSVPWTQLLYARAQLLLCQGRPQQALAEAEECGRRLADRGWVSPAPYAWRSLAALAHAACDNGARATALFTEELRLAERWGTDSTRSWAELRRRFASPVPRYAGATERALRRLGPTPASLRFAQAIVTRETAALHHASRVAGSPGSEDETGNGRTAAP
jgi:tetratricopeptide (TPR) repeat protein